jgi:competence/damage-inducible protein CinA-like protein
VPADRDEARARPGGSGQLLTRPRAAIVVTGSELVRGERTDRNGPFLAAQVLALGLEPARITIVGDRPDELLAALEEGAQADICLVSGGLGPTHDDRTAELVARAAGVELVLDPALEAEIEGISRAIAQRLRRPYGDFAPGVRKQASLPAGALSLGLAGTAPGFVVDGAKGPIVVLPGPPLELQRLWPRALEVEAVRHVLQRAQRPGRRVLRFYGASESAVARALEDAGGDGDGVEATICARDFEIHVDLLVDPGAEERADGLVRRLRAPLEEHLFSEDERPVEEIVLGLCRARGLSLATAESCTGGLVAARLTSIPGSSDVFLGGVVAYSNELKRSQLGVPAEVLEEHGAVSPQAAEAMAVGARGRLGADVAVSVTGIAGPGGGTSEKPVGLVYLHAETPDVSRAIEFDFPGDREAIRVRSAVSALHLVRRLLTQSRHESV